MYTGPNIVKNGLVLWLDAANPRSYPGSGTTWADLSGNGNNMILANSPSYITTYNGGLVFNGTTQYGYTNNNIFNVEGPGTLIFTQTYNVINAGGVYSTIGVGNGTSTAIQIGIRANVGTVWKYGGNSLLTYPIPTVNTISTIAVSYNESNISLYTNGILTNTTSLAANQSGLGKLTISSYTSASALEPVNMNMYGIQLYNRVLSASEVNQNFQATRARYGV